MYKKALLMLLVLLGVQQLAIADYRQANKRLFRSGQDRALFFAVSNYEDDGLTDLPQSIENADAIAGILANDYGFETEVVKDPTLEQIRSKLIAYQQQYANNEYAAEGQLLIFFSGHGVKEYGAGYFLAADAKPELVINTGLAYSTWRGFINDINCQHILVAVDACYSVTFDPNWPSKGNDDGRFRRKGELSESDRLLANHKEHPSRLFFTSDAQEDIVPGRSNFARKMIAGLNRSYTRQAFLSAEELFATTIKLAQPTPHAGDFGKDDPRSSFLFFRNASINIGDAKADQAAYIAAKEEGTLAACLQYLHDFPQGDFVSIIQQQIDELEADKQEVRAWDQAKAQNTAAVYQSFISRYPNSIYVAVAENKLKTISLINTTSSAPDNFVRIEGGTFQMGDTFGEGQNDETVHSVTVSTFYMSKYEVTFVEYDVFCEATGRDKPSDRGWGRGQRPVINVSWCDAVAYANWLSDRNGLQKVYNGDCKNIRANWNANGYRLPTEAEWEYAAREDGRKVRFGNGEEILRPSEANFYSEESAKQAYSEVGPYRAKTVVVGSLKHPNALGLHDISGNVLEWCWDWYGTYPTIVQTNPRGASKGSGRVLRGGSWGNFARNCRAAHRSSWGPGNTGDILGFRLARSL